MSSTQPWEEEFDKKDFKYYDTYNNAFKSVNDDPLSDEIKSFISQLLKEERAKLLEEIEKKVNLINVSGGGSGRMLKLQLLDYLNLMK